MKSLVWAIVAYVIRAILTAFLLLVLGAPIWAAVLGLIVVLEAGNIRVPA